MARWLVKILKTLINTGESGIVYCMECRKYVGLTLTWDVLKRNPSCLLVIVFRINFNMGCIETILEYQCRVITILINFNMGCIETRQIDDTCLINLD